MRNAWTQAAYRGKFIWVYGSREESIRVRETWQQAAIAESWENTSSSTCKKWRRNQKWGSTIKSQSLLPGITSSSKAMPHNHKGSIASPKQHHQGSNTWAMRNISYSDHHRIFMESNYSPQNKFARANNETLMQLFICHFFFDYTRNSMTEGTGATLPNSIFVVSI